MIKVEWKERDIWNDVWCDEWKLKMQAKIADSHLSINRNVFFFLHHISQCITKEDHFAILWCHAGIKSFHSIFHNAQCTMFCVFVVMLPIFWLLIICNHMISNFKWFHVRLYSYNRCAIYVYDLWVAGAVLWWIKLLTISAVWHCWWVHEKNERENDRVEWIWAAVC